MTAFGINTYLFDSDLYIKKGLKTQLTRFWPKKISSRCINDLNPNLHTWIIKTYPQNASPFHNKKNNPFVLYQVVRAILFT